MGYKVMTFNLLYGGHEGEPVALETRKPRMLEVIREELPDLIDYIFSNGTASSIKIVPDAHPDGVWYSDHYAVCAEMEPKNRL